MSWRFFHVSMYRFTLFFLPASFHNINVLQFIHLPPTIRYVGNCLGAIANNVEASIHLHASFWTRTGVSLELCINWALIQEIENTLGFPNIKGFNVEISRWEDNWKCWRWGSQDIRLELRRPFGPVIMRFQNWVIAAVTAVVTTIHSD